MKPFASLSLDLDNAWSYLKIHGDPSWAQYPTYLDIVVPRVLEFLAERDLRITFFIVGKDAALAKNRASLRMISSSGHEIANHSFLHEPWIAHAPYDQARDEIMRAHQAIAAATGVPPCGFRGPGFATSPQLLDALADCGYVYDASILPTFIGPLARWYYFRHAELSAQERAERRELFGNFSHGFLPNRAHLVRTARSRIVEIPVTTMPALRVPMHCSYLLYLDAISPAAADAYFAAALNLCALTRQEPSLLLHPLDFLGADDDLPQLRFFPGMARPAREKLHAMERFIDAYRRRFAVGRMIDHAERVAQKTRGSMTASTVKQRA